MHTYRWPPGQCLEVVSTRYLNSAGSASACVLRWPSQMTTNKKGGYKTGIYSLTALETKCPKSRCR